MARWCGNNQNSKAGEEMTDTGKALKLMEAMGNELNLADAQTLQFIKDKYCPEATELEFQEFAALCQMHGANPLRREIYFIKFGGKNPRASIVFSYHFLLKRAQATGVYQGLTEPEFLDDKGNWHTVWTAQGMPVACRVGIYRNDWPDPRYVTVKWSEVYKDQGEWKKQPLNMLEVRAIVKGLRRFIPDIGDMYVQGEIADHEERYEVDPDKTMKENVDGAVAKVRERKNAKSGNVTADGELMIDPKMKSDLQLRFKDLGLKKADAVGHVNEILKALDLDTIKSLTELTMETAEKVKAALDVEVRDLQSGNLEEDPNMFKEGE